jgi:hypothetical protein
MITMSSRAPKAFGAKDLTIADRSREQAFARHKLGSEVPRFARDDQVSDEVQVSCHSSR